MLIRPQIIGVVFYIVFFQPQFVFITECYYPVMFLLIGYIVLNNTYL